MKTPRPDAIATGTLAWAIVQSFDGHSHDSSRPQPYTNPADRTGTAMLVNTRQVQPFARRDARSPIRDDTATLVQFETARTARLDDISLFDTITPGLPILVETNGQYITRWTRCELILRDVYDHRYLKPQSAQPNAVFTGLHCVVNLAAHDPIARRELITNGPGGFFPSPTVYIGHYADTFLAQTKTPYLYGIYGWDQDNTDQPYLVSVEARLT